MASRLPLRAVFIVTSAMLFVMAIKMIGDAILEFQEQLIVPSNPVAALGWMLELGLNPTREALMAQGAVIVLAIVTFLLWRRNASGTTKAVKASVSLRARAAGLRRPPLPSPWAACQACRVCA